MTPLGTNPSNGSSPGSHHLVGLSGEKFWARVKTRNIQEVESVGSVDSRVGMSGLILLDRC
jgi:hypothetical protein